MRFLSFLLQKFPHDYTCAVCGAETFESDFICHRCKSRLSAITGKFCPKCGRRTVADGLCLACKDDPPAFDAARAAFDYIPPGSTVIKHFKFDNRPYLGKVLAPFLAKTWTAAGFSADVVTFVPMTAKKERRRGYNQAHLLAEETAHLLNLPLRPLVLKVKESKTQHELTRAERLENLSGCFRLAEGAEVKDLSVLVIDDVITTGSTLSALAKVLKRRGAAKVYGLTFAATPDPAVRLLMENGLFLKEPTPETSPKAQENPPLPQESGTQATRFAQKTDLQANDPAQTPPAQETNLQTNDPAQIPPAQETNLQTNDPAQTGDRV